MMIFHYVVDSVIEESFIAADVCNFAAGGIYPVNTSAVGTEPKISLMVTVNSPDKIT